VAKKNRRWIFLLPMLILGLIGLFSYGGKLTRLIELPDGITISVPRNFPRPVSKEEQGLKILSFNVQPHQDAKRFIHFFEIVSSPLKIDFLKRIPPIDFKIGKANIEKIFINGQNVDFNTVELEIILPCGSKEKTKLYALEYFCGPKNKHVYILTFTMTKKGFLEIVKTLKCH